jgi:hypothetical protein
MRKSLSVFGLAALAALACTAQAQPQPLPGRKPPPHPAGPPAQTAAPQPAPAAPVAQAPGAPAASGLSGAVEVAGFRSAKFGMSEAEVRNAIVKDFKVKPDAIRTEDNKVEQTRVLQVQIPDVLPSGGTADASYVFGFKSKRLIQVGLTWSKATDEKMTAEQLFSNANVLRSHFATLGYRPDSVATNMPINGGLLMFRGSDAQDHTTLLILQGTFAQGEKNQRVLTPTALLLFYIADAKSPDVYRLPPGSF